MSNDALRRIMAEVKEFNTVNKCDNTFFHALPLESDLFEWHFTVRGPPDTAFSDGVYHGRILLPAEYPLKPPEIILLTQNGRFEVGKRICLSVTAHHQETWQPSWGIRTILTALVGFMPSKAEGVGALDYPDEDRRRLARKSWHFHCDRCGARPIEQLVVPAAVTAGFPGTKCLIGDSSSPTSPESLVSVPQPHLPEPSLMTGASSEVHAASMKNTKQLGAAIHSVPTPTDPNAHPASQGSSSSQIVTSSNIRASSSTFPISSTSCSSAPVEGAAESSHPLSSDLGLHPSAGVTVAQDMPNSTRDPQTEVESQPGNIRAGCTSTLTQGTASRNIREPELLFLACAIGVVIVAIILRRVFIIALQ